MSFRDQGPVSRKGMVLYVSEPMPFFWGENPMFLPRFAKELGVVVWLSGFGGGCALVIRRAHRWQF